MIRTSTIFAAVAATVLGSAAVLAQGQQAQQPMRFFVASEAHSGNFGGLAGADAYCQRLAAGPRR